MRFDRPKFFTGYRQQFGSLSQKQVDALNKLLAAVEADEHMDDARWLAYVFATTYHETARTFEPIEEFEHGHGRKYGDPDPNTGQTYFGRGFVQLTWFQNYKQFGEKLGIDLVHSPALALDFETAYKIMSLGMREGLFTGKGLPRYINAQGCDFTNSRKIINGLDKAAVIASYATKFLKVLEESAEKEERAE